MLSLDKVPAVVRSQAHNMGLKLMAPSAHSQLSEAMEQRKGIGFVLVTQPPAHSASVLCDRKS